jgi:predicted amidophosphoribosyltransferase
VLAPLRYAFPVDRAIGALKFHGRLEHGRLLGELLAGWLAARAPELAGGVLLPMPLHPARLAERGFNQASEVARWVAAIGGLRIDPDLARRVRATAEQARLDAAARHRNLAGAFAAPAHPPGCAAPAHPPARLVVLDDVVTTGATADALAAVLRRAGVDEVVVVAVARAAR